MTFSSWCQNNELLFVSHFTGSGNNYGGATTGGSIAKDSQGNIYVLGAFSGTVNQDAFSISSTGGNDLYIAKYNNNGIIKWLKKIGSTGNESPGGIELSNDETKLYISGAFFNTCSFDALPAIVSTGGSDGFLASYDTSGTALWAKNVVFATGNYNSPVNGLAISENDTLAIVGFFLNNVDFGSGYSFSSIGTRNLYFAKFDKTGNIVNAKRIVSNNTSAVIDLGYYNQSYFITGSFIDSLYTTPTPIFSNSGTYDMFVHKCDVNGNGVWTRKIQGSGQDYARALSVDGNGNSYMCGYFGSSTMLVDSTNALLSTKVATNNGGNDIFTVKYDFNGNLQWFDVNGTILDEVAYGIYATNSEIMVTGQFSNVLNFAGSSITTRGGVDAYFMVYGSDKQQNFARSSGGTLDDLAKNCLIDNGKYYVFSEALSPSISFDGDWANVWTKTNASALRDLTIACYGPFYNDTTINNVPCSGGNNGSIELAPNGGRAPYTYVWSDGQSSSTATNLSAGTYDVTVIDANGARIRDTITLATTPELAISILDTVTINCQNINNGTATVIPAGGNTPFTYAWTGSASTTDIANDLGVGWHYVSVTDVCGTKKDSVFVKSLPSLSATLSTHAQLLICATDANGEVTVQTTNGVAPFVYTWDDGSLLGSRNDLDTGWHFVTITDVCAVPIKDSIRVNYLPEVNVNITSSSPASCPVGGDGYAFALATSGVPPYSYAWSNSASTTSSASDLLSGWQYVTVTDFCKTAKDSINVSWLPVVTSTTTLVSKVTCTGLNNGSATVNATLGKTPYTYLWSTGQNTATATNLVEGWNYVTVTDACTSTRKDSVFMTIESALTDTVELTKLADCPTSSNGRATVTVLSGVPVYSYLWDNGITTATNNSLTVGWHFVTITDGCGPKKDSVLVTNKPIMVASLSTTNILLTCASDHGTATVLIQDGVAPFTYQWDDILAPGATRNDLDTGWHYVTVTDVCNNPFTGTVRVNHLPEVYSTTTLISSSSCPAGGDGVATVNATSGVPPYTYAWSNSASTSATAGDLLTGWQYVTVTDYCISRKDSVFVTPNPPLATAITASAPTNCTGAFNGSATVAPSNGGGTYTYLWTSAETTASATALGEGWNYVTVTDFCGSTKKDSVYISVQSALVETVALTAQASCPASTNGVATVTVTSGVAPFTYAWSSGGTGTVESGLPVGWVFVTITDGCGPKKDSVLVTNKPLMNVALSTQNILLTCANDLGTVTVLVTDGVAPFTYQWDDILAPGATRTLDTGWHYVTVTDICNNPYYDSVRVNHLPEVYSTIASSTPASCPAGGDGVATVQATSGVPPYSYAWSNSTSNSATATDLLTGWQYVTVSDYCISRLDSIFVLANPPLETSISAFTPTSCTGTFNGSATVSPSNGGGSYTFIWTSSETTATATALGEGWNYVTVSDACGSSIVDSVEITVQSALLATISMTAQTNCPASAEGVAMVNVTSGVAPFTYAWSSGGSAATETNLPAGWVWVTITDGCGPKTDSVEITHKPLLQVSLSTQNILLTCANDLGTVTILAQNGVTPYTFTWDDGLFLNATRTLDTGWHYVTVTDVCNNPYLDSVRVNHLPEVNANIVSSSLASCPSGGDGVAIVQASSGVPPYSYAWSNSSSNSTTASDLLSGWQYVTVSDYCTSVVDSVEIGFMPALEAAISASANVNCTSGSDGTATVVATNGGQPYTYVWTSGETNATAIALQSGWNWVTVTDLCGTEVIDSVEILINAPLTITNIQVSPTSCSGGNNGSATVNISGGSAPISFLWSDTQTGQTATGLINDTYFVTVTDVCGSVSSSATVGYLPLLSATITANVAASCATTADGKAMVTAYNGSGNYTYQWSGSTSTSPTVLDLTPGLHYVTVSDDCGSVLDSVQIGIKPALDATVHCAGPATCQNTSDGIAVVIPIDGVPPYSYAWSGSVETDSIASALPVGPVTVTITDACGSIERTLNVISMPAMTFASIATNLRCFADTSGTITVTPSLGVPPYTYAWGDTTLTDSLRHGLAAGSYTITVTDFCGSQVQTFTLSQPGALSISLLPTHVLFQGESTGKIDLIVSGGTAPYYFAWSNASPMEDQYNLTEGMYAVTVSDNNLCVAIDSIEIVSLQKHIIIYSAFTPNDDGKNDVWNIKHIQNFPDCDVSIYNEWGVLMFRSTGYETPWDGTKDGKPLPAAAYYYVIDLKDGSEAYTGSVTLMK
jgi:gliding motility-associated-like protein